MRGLRALGASLAGVALLMGLALSNPLPARAAEPQAYVAITFTGMSPALPKRDGTVRLQGIVTNTSKVELSNLQAIFWRSLDPIQDHEGMDAALASAANEPLGARKQDVYENIPSEADRVLAPKESASFSLTVPVSALTLPPIDAIYLLGVHVRGRLVPNGPDITLGRGRVFAPIVDTPPANPAQLSTLVVLESRPSLIGRNVFCDDHLAAEVGSDGRLTALLKAADTGLTSFAVDPALIDELQTMRSGYQVRTGDGTNVTGTGSTAAGRWLADYTRMAQRRTGFRLLYAHPDVTALVHADLSSVLTGGQKASAAITTTAGLSLLAMAAGGQVDQASIDALAALKPRAIVVDDASTGQSRPLLEGPDGIPLLNTAAITFGGGPGPDPRQTPVQIRQHTLAETWLEADAAQADDTIGQLRIVRTKAQARSNDRDVNAPWLKRESLDRLLQSTPASWPERYRYADVATQRELSPMQLGGIRGLQSGYQVVADLLARPTDVQPDADAATARSASASWRGEESAWEQFIDPQLATVSGIRTGAVKIVTTPKVVTSAHSVMFPVTVRNTLPPDPDDPDRNAIRVQLQFTSANGQRLTVSPSDEMRDMEIPAGAGVTSNAKVDARANGTVRVTVRAYTLDGTPVGSPFQIDVQATQAGTLGWLIAIAAGIVLVGGSALRIRQVAKERTRGAVTADRGDTDSRDPEQRDPEKLDA
ncbi:MAG TPA: hypothetical protein VFP34_18625 [Microlunatus sp.]|nr:hypothetical protein [Microlunatus sp.]